MSRRQALEEAYARNLDLLCVAPKAELPVCKILDYGKYKFAAQKKAKEAKKNQKIIEVREIQLTPQIGINDLLTKAKKANEFLKEGNKVKVGVRFRGRQLAHVDLGEEVLNNFINECSLNGSIEKAPILEGRWLTCYIIAKTKK